MNRIDLVDCKAIVTGGSGGLGQAIMARLRRSGAAVANFDRRDGGALAEAELFCACDVTDEAAVDEAVGRAVDAFGRIDILVNNAGIAAEAKPIAQASVEAWLTEKKVDGVAQDPQTIMVPLSQKGIPTQIMYFRDHGVALVSFGLVANTDKLKANPDLYKRFVAASLKGLAASIKNPEAGVDALRKRYPDSAPKATALESFSKYDIPTFCIAGAKSLGSPPQSAWDTSYEIMTKSMNIPTDKPMTYYYTTDYLPADAPGC